MAHPYSSNPYAGTPSYPAQQQSYYPSFSSNGLQQQVQTPPGLVQQPAQVQSQQQQSFPAYHHQQQQQQPSPSTNGPRFEQNSQIPPSAPPYPHFPPPPINFNPDFFKQFANAGFPPPPPPPNLPPVPLPSPGYPQLHAPVNTSTSSPYPQFHAAGPQGFGSVFAQNEHPPQLGGNQYMGAQQGTQSGMEWQRETQTYAAPAGAQAGDSHNVRPISRGLISLSNDKDQLLPSFGSRSDLDMLFATAQHQIVQAPPAQETGIPQDASRMDATDHDLIIDGGASPYDPTRPATIEARSLGSFAPPSSASKTSAPKKMERIYDNKSHAELRQLAKGAVLSLVPHKILYADLVKEGVDPQILRELYGELGLKVDPRQPQPHNDDHVQDNEPKQAVPTSPSTQQLEIEAHGFASKSPDTQGNSIPPAATAESVPPATVVDVRKQQSAPSPSLERKDRIAQLLAAKAGRPSPSPVAQSSTIREEHTAAAPTATFATTMEVAAAPSTSATPPVSQPEAVTSTQFVAVNKSKAQTELVRQKMEQLKREAQARSDATSSRPPQAPLGTPKRSEPDVARVMPQFGSVTPLSASKVSSFLGQPSATSLIPGLFMSSTEVPALTDSAINSSPFQALPFSNVVPSKRTLDYDTASPAFQPPAKKPNLQQELQLEPSVPPSDNDLDYQSEGEVVEDAESDAMLLDQDSEQAPEQEYQPYELSNIAPVSHKPIGLDQASTAAPQTASNNGPGSDNLYRAKQTEIEAMHRRIAEMERNKLKRTKSQLESPASSKPATPPVAGQDQPLNSSPILQTADLIGTQRQTSGARTTSKLTREQLLERAATLKAEVLKQRSQRQQVLQEGLPDLNAEVQNTETQLNKSHKELVHVRAQIQSLRAELDRLVVQEKELDGEVVRFEQQLEEGREGQKQYSDELQLIKLEKLAEEQADPVPQGPGQLSAPQPEKAAGEVFPGSNIGGPDHQEATPKVDHTLSDVLVEDTNAAMVDDEGDTEMQVDDDDESPLSELTESPVHEEPEVAPALEAASEQHQEMQGDLADGSPAAHYAATTDTEAEATDAQIQAAIDDQLGAGEMEISPGPEDFVESHESLPTPLMTAHEFVDEAMDMDDDSDGSASMSDSDDEEGEYEPAEADGAVPLPEEEYEPAEADVSAPMQQSDDEGEYDPETAPVESGAPTPGFEEHDSVYDPAALVQVPGSVLASAEPELPVNGTSAAATNATESPAEAEVMIEDVPAVSDVPANTKDDLESQAQLAEADAQGQQLPGLGETVQADAFLDGSSTSTMHYVPYKTPLSSFKSYRFHSDFNDTVKSGYRSLTYSNSIDPSRPLCATELSGQTCIDANCEDQHFSQLGLPDEKILVQMSSGLDIKDKTTREEFHAGLKVVIAGLRANDVKDFEKVADALSKFRRDFFADRAKEEQEVEDKGLETVVQDAEEGRIGEDPTS